MPDTDDHQRRFASFSKDIIATSVVLFSFIVVFYLINRAFATDNLDDPRAKDIMGIILPIVGTWMGTILAFYYTKENFESASRSMQETIRKLTPDEKLKSMKASEAMISFDKIDKFAFTETKTITTTPIVEFIDFLDSKNRNRLVVFEDNKVKYVVHKSTFNDFIYRQITYNDKADKDSIKTCTLGNMLEAGTDQNIKNTVENSVECIVSTATLYDCQQKMAANKYCQDVFLTASGSKDEPVLGWVTSAMLAEQGRV